MDLQMIFRGGHREGRSQEGSQEGNKDPAHGGIVTQPAAEPTPAVMARGNGVVRDIFVV
jgi:hypothetical protein